MTTLTEFLLARIAEDEESVITMDCNCGHRGDRGAAKSPPAANCPERVLAECEAKRRRVDLFSQWDASCPPDDWPGTGSLDAAPMSDAGRYLLRIEALPYADHPDYREEWRP